MMGKKILITAVFICHCFCIHAQLNTRWTKLVNEKNALIEYPRPQMMRNNWTNLNGSWDYAITGEHVSAPSTYDGKILVPFGIESALSGVKKTLLPNQRLWYRRIITKPESKNNDRILLHFGAVDFEAQVFVNGKEIGRHIGGYTEFSFDVTGVLNAGNNELVVKVYDPTDQGLGPRGKQVLNPQSIYYTSTSGIWQTVWMETVPQAYLEQVRIEPDIDKGYLYLDFFLGGDKAHSSDYTLEVDVLDKNKVVGRINHETLNGKELPWSIVGDQTVCKTGIHIESAHLWSPNDPFLYDLVIRLLYKGKKIDEVKSYAGMRKVNIQKDANGVDRIFLNNQYLYNLGVLDQGFWPDGIYTAPTDEALAFDIKAIKSMGFNTIRKHIKVEPARWYYHADKIGMIVWQDFVQPDFGLREGSKPLFEKQLEETIDQLYSHPSITTWVLFNEKWGQYDQQRLSVRVKQLDPTRILNGHSGEILYVNETLRSPSPKAWEGSDITDIHSYPNPMNAPKLNGKARVLGEFGGIGVFIEDHQWLSGKSWGYVQSTPASLLGKYAIMNQDLQLLEKEGLSGSIYTQPFDVEGEQNGLMTYDREITKMPVEELRKIHARLVTAPASLPVIALTAPDMTDPAKRYAALLQQYIDGKKDAEFLRKLSMMAAQNGDKVAIPRIAGDYMATWKSPYSKDQLEFAVQNTIHVDEPGFVILQKEFDNPESLLDKKAINNTLINAIYADLIKGPVDAGDPDWNELRDLTRPYGSFGEQIYLRARVLYYANAKDWQNFKFFAPTYIQKYGQYVSASQLKQIKESLNN